MMSGPSLSLVCVSLLLLTDECFVSLAIAMGIGLTHMLR